MCSPLLSVFEEDIELQPPLQQIKTSNLPGELTAEEMEVQSIVFMCCYSVTWCTLCSSGIIHQQLHRCSTVGVRQLMLHTWSMPSFSHLLVLATAFSFHKAWDETHYFRTELFQLFQRTVTNSISTSMTAQKRKKKSPEVSEGMWGLLKKLLLGLIYINNSDFTLQRADNLPILTVLAMKSISNLVHDYTGNSVSQLYT